jgi:hypothetical protein
VAFFFFFWGVYFFVFFQKKCLQAALSAESGKGQMRVETRPVIIERNVLKADVMVPPFDFIDQLIRENHWDYLYHCSGIVYPRMVRDFYGYLEVIQDEQSGLTLQTTVRGGTSELMLRSSGLIQFHLKAVLSQIPWFDPQHRA